MHGFPYLFEPCSPASLLPRERALLLYVILGEPPTPIHFFGGLLILGGVWASE